VTTRRNWLGPLLILAGGCPAARGPATVKPPPPDVRVIVVKREPEPGQLRELLAALGERAQIEQVQPEPPRPPVSHAEAIRKNVEQAREHYLTMKMESARAELQRALRLAGKSHARGLSSRELAEIHLLLAAVNQALRRTRSMRRHCTAAAGYDPALSPNPDLISPPVREAFEQAKRERESMEVVVRSEPAGARVTWDGVDRGPSPATIPDQFKGEHYLIVEHPLYRPWGERIVLSTSAELQVKLEPAGPAQLLAALGESPEAAGRAAELLGVDAVVLPEETEAGLRLRVLARSGERTLVLAPASPQSVVQKTARAIASGPAKPTAVASASQPTSQPAGETKTRDDDRDREGGLAGHFRRYWWAWTFVGVAVVTTAIVLPLTLGGDDVEARAAVLNFP